jgi:homopolymeric O-antigen transport system ATP-binding protein
MTSVAFQSVSKSYPIYDAPVDRLKELLTFQRSRHHRVFWALRDVSFEASKGSTFCVIGENGSGKSTSLQLVAGIFAPTEGQVEVNGRVSALLELGAGFNPEFSGRDNVFLSAAIHGLATKQIERRFRDIEQFAEIGEFIDQPVKTYSSGMLVRLAFAVAIHVDPDILLVDEALAVGDYYFRQRCMRKVLELRQRQVTILFVSHSMADVKAIGSDALWLDNGRVVEIGKPDAVVRKYLARMVEKDAEFLKRKGAAATRPELAQAVVAPEIVETIPNVDFRHGNQAAEIIGIAALDADGCEVRLIEPHRRLTLRISVRARQPLDEPNVGFMLRNHLGMDFAGTNTAREGIAVPPMAAGDIFTVDFHLEIPELYPGNFSFSPAIANGSLEAYEMCDWIDNALTLPMARGDGAVYGYIHLPCRIDINTPLRKAQAAPPPVSSWKG